MYKPLESDLDCIFILAGLLFFGIQEERQTLEKSTEKTLKSPQNCKVRPGCGSVVEISLLAKKLSTYLMNALL